MDEHKNRTILKLRTPQPRRITLDLKLLTKKNPFQEKELPAIKPIISNNEEEDKVFKELHSILLKPSFSLPPINKKKTWLKIPDRERSNPIIHNQKFIELNSTASSAFSSQEDLNFTSVI